MLKNLAQLTHIVGEETIHLLCSNSCSLTALQEALFEFIKFVGRAEEVAKAMQSQEASNAKAQEDAHAELPKEEEPKSECFEPIQN